VAENNLAQCKLNDWYKITCWTVTYARKNVNEIDNSTTTTSVAWPPSRGTTSSRWTATQTPSTAGAARTTTSTTGSSRCNGGKHVFWVADAPDEYARIFVPGKPIFTLNQWWLKSFLTLPSDDTVENSFSESPTPRTNTREYLFMACLFWN
jgi:hypothetical protein